MVRDIEIEEVGVKPFLFSYRAIMATDKEEVNTKFQSASKLHEKMEALEIAAYWGFYFGHLKRYKTEPDFSRDTISEWIEEDMSLLEKVSGCITEGMAKFQEAQEGKQKALKK